MMPPWVLLWAKTMWGQKVMGWERVGGVFSAFKVNIVFLKILIWEKDTNFKVTVQFERCFRLMEHISVIS